LWQTACQYTLLMAVHDLGVEQHRYKRHRKRIIPLTFDGFRSLEPEDLRSFRNALAANRDRFCWYESRHVTHELERVALAAADYAVRREERKHSIN
jgi:hypothetical protein